MPDTQPTAAASDRACRAVYDLTGVVQGVGFRPAIYRLARAADLGGSVQNRSGSVRLVLEGPLERIRAFLAALPADLPPNARLDSIAEIENSALPRAPLPFCIASSDSEDAMQVVVPADLAICPDCRREVLDPANRRFGYAFTTCTCCGPRYTVINGLPYDRVRTTMSAFPLCAACQREYDDPADRRFHAESIACPACGPRLWLEDAQGNRVAGDPLRAARAALAAGRIVAVRGLGGFLLAADATHRKALEELRRRKRRPHKPFAVMARALATVEQVCEVDAASARMMESAAAPIIILEIRAGTAGALPLDLLAPDTHTLGVMLPTTPPHLLLATPLPGDPVPPFDWLVMTSGNRGGEPICITNDEARARLAGIADLYLLHDREINLRCDDSILAAASTTRPRRPAAHQTVPAGGAPASAPAPQASQIWRRARGFAPEPLRLARPLARTVLAMGAELKNAMAIGYDDRVVASPHVGDLEAPEAVDGLRQVAEALPRFVNRVPQVVAVDAHPDMHSTRLGREIAQRLGIPAHAVQHHHAHAAACLAEHGLAEGLALVFDGTGLGPDGHIWGAELLDVRVDGTFQRLASFAGVPLPGGDAAVQRPARQLAGRCAAAGLDLAPAELAALGIGEEEWQVWQQQSRAGLNAPMTHAAGRLFDSFAVALGVANRVTTYEGQTAIRLEASARSARVAGGYVGTKLPYQVLQKDGVLWVDWSDAFRHLYAHADAAKDAPAWAYAAHVAIADAAAQMVAFSRSQNATAAAVALSGGVFMNRLLCTLLVPQLEAAGLTVLQHCDTPPNDGGIAVGQVVVAGGSDARGGC